VTIFKNWLASYRKKAKLLGVRNS